MKLKVKYKKIEKKAIQKKKEGFLEVLKDARDRISYSKGSKSLVATSLLLGAALFTPGRAQARTNPKQVHLHIERIAICRDESLFKLDEKQTEDFRKRSGLDHTGDPPMPTAESKWTNRNKLTESIGFTGSRWADLYARFASGTEVEWGTRNRLGIGKRFPFPIEQVEYESSEELDRLLIEELLKNETIKVVVEVSPQRGGWTNRFRRGTVKDTSSLTSDYYSIAFEAKDQTIAIPDINMEFSERFDALQQQIKKLNDKNFEFFFYPILLGIISSLFASCIIFLLKKRNFIQQRSPVFPSFYDPNADPLRPNVAIPGWSRLANRATGEERASLNQPLFNLNPFSHQDRIYELLYKIPAEFKELIRKAKKFLEGQMQKDGFKLILLGGKTIEYLKEEITLSLFRLHNLVYSAVPMNWNDDLFDREFNKICVELKDLLGQVEWVEVGNT